MVNSLAIGYQALAIVIVNYNCAVTSYVLYIRNNVEYISSDNYVLATLSLLLGLFLGQLIFGIMGDILGRKASLVGSTMFLLAGAVLSLFTGLFPVFSTNTTFMAEFSSFRFLLGVGAGGLYPLIATISRESSQEGMANTNIALIYGPYGSIGLIFAPLITYLVLLVTEIDDDLKWRIILAIGVTPCLFLSFVIIDTDITEIESKSMRHYKESEHNVLKKFRKSYLILREEVTLLFEQRQLRMNFFGVSASWFASDFLHYGNLLMQLKLVQSLIKRYDHDDDYIFTIQTLTLLGMLFATLFWIGGLFSIIGLRAVSALALQLQGFALSACAYLVVTLSKALLPAKMWFIVVFFYSLTYFFNGLGPAPTTFFMPSLLFPRKIRTTANGLAAGAGKIGSIVGIVIAGYAGLDISTLMAVFASVAIFGCGSTLLLIREHFSMDSVPQGDGKDLIESPIAAWLEKRRTEGASSFEKKRLLFGDDNLDVGQIRL